MKKSTILKRAVIEEGKVVFKKAFKAFFMMGVIVFIQNKIKKLVNKLADLKAKNGYEDEEDDFDFRKIEVVAEAE